MKKRPLVIGMLLCEQLVVEEETRNVSLINCFTSRVVEASPSEPLSFVVFASLIDGEGQIRVDVRIRHLLDLDEIYRRSGTVLFEDPLAEVRVRLRVLDLSFPAAGDYEVVLSVEGEPVAQRKLRIIEEGQS